MAKRSSLRASDADRDGVAERLRQAAADGRLLAHELEERLSVALRAQTYGELDAVVADLPGRNVSGRRQRGPRSRSMELAREHPLLGAAVLVAVTLVALVTAAIVLAGLFAFSGVWIIIALILWTRRGRGPVGPRHYRHRGYGYRPGYRSYR